jgi:site-specific recombinase XerD
MSNLSTLRLDGGVPGPVDSFLLEIEAHWVNDAGLRENTRKRYVPSIRRFLAAQFPTGAVDWASITPVKIADFIATELQRSGNRHTQKGACCAIRALLRYVRLKYSLTGGPELLLPRLPYWRHAPIDEAAPRPDSPAFPSRRGHPLTRFGVTHLLRQAVHTATPQCPGLADKKVSPHTLRHYLPFRIMSSARKVFVV